MKFAVKLPLAFSFVVIASTTVIAYLAWNSNVNILESEIRNNFEVSALRTINQIDVFLYERFQNIQFIANDPVITSHESKPDDITKRLIDYRNRLKVYASLSFYDLERNRIADTAGLSIGRQDELSGFWVGFFNEAVQGTVGATSDYRIAEDLQTEVVSFAAPVRDKNGETFAAVVARVPMDNLHSIITQIQGADRANNRTILIDLVNRDGLLIYSNHGRKDVMRKSLPGWDAVREEMKGGKVGTLKANTPEGKDSITVAVSEQGFLDFPGNGWAMILSVPRSVAFAPAAALRNKILIVLAIVLVLSILLSLALALTLSRPLMKLAGVIQQVASGDLGFWMDSSGRSGKGSAQEHPLQRDRSMRVSGESRHDEIGVLIRGFNYMLTQIQARNTMLQEAQDKLEQRVKQRTAELEVAQRQLIEASREAGMAEVATNVLHNVGNVLNSVNVSAAVLSESIRKSKATNLSKAATMLQENRENLPEFLGNDPRGRQLPGYLVDLSQHLTSEREGMLTELASLTKNIEHIKDIVAMQQTYGKVAGIKERVLPKDLVEDSLRLNGTTLEGNGVQIVRDYKNTPSLYVEKHRVIQILVNLIRNAKYALDEGTSTPKRLLLKVGISEKNRVLIEVTDNGVGISPEIMPRIFEHGFTTRTSGHGFGLHGAVLTAMEMGGSLKAFSDGSEKGATFKLELPSATDTSEEDKHAS